MYRCRLFSLMASAASAEQAGACMSHKRHGRFPQLCAWLTLNSVIVRPAFNKLNLLAFKDRAHGCPASAGSVRSNTTVNSTGLEVIVVHPGHTGSSSMSLALERLGLRTYAPGEEAHVFGDSEAHAWHGSDSTYLISLFRDCRVKAFNADDVYNKLPLLVSLSPKVKIIHMVREWHRWNASATRSAPLLKYEFMYMILFGLLLCDWLPYGIHWPKADVGRSFMNSSMTSVLFSHCFRMGRPAYPWGGARQFGMTEELYHRSQAEARRLVPQDNFLEFDPTKHAWAELGGFLGRPAPPTGTPFPRVKAGWSMKWSTYWTLFPGLHVAFVALMVASIAVNWLMFRIVVYWSVLSLGCISRMVKDKRE